MARGGPAEGAAATGRFFERVYEVVSEIPPGRVATYGTISSLVAGRPTAARTVGWALGGLTPDRADVVPWWRVINARGLLSLRGTECAADEQRARLEDEGIEFDARGRVDLERFGWSG